MSNTVLIGVGGSGQHVVHAYLRLLALTNVDPNTIPEIYIIDADDSELSKQIAALHTLLTGAKSNENAKSLGNVIRPYFQENENDTPDNASSSFNIKQHGIFEAAFLMDEDVSVDIKEGMFANARIGASVFRVKNINTTDDTKSVNFKTLFSHVKDARVAIVGSSFGGTGSGVVPALVREFETHKSHKKDAPEVVRAFMTLPWFEIEDNNSLSGDKKSAARADASLDPMQRNASLGLRTYLKELESGLEITNYLVSQFVTEQKSPTRLDKGNFKQPENKHIYNIILANAIQHFLQEDSQVLKDGNSSHLLSLLMQTEEKKSGLFDAINSHHLRLRIGINDNRCLQEIFMDANVVALVLEKAAQGITTGLADQKLKIDGADDTYPIPKPLIELIKKIDPTMMEVDNSSIFSKVLGAKERIKKEGFDALAKSIHQISKRLRESILWLYAHKEFIKFEPSNIELLFLENNDIISEASLENRWPAYKLTRLVRRSNGTQISSDRNPNPKTKKTAQAFFLFENIFFEGKQGSCFDYKPKFDLGDANKTRYNHQTGYDLAAELIAEQIFEEVRAARHQETQYKTDAQDNGNEQQLAHEPLEKMLNGFSNQTAFKPLTLKLCQITKLKEDVEKDYKILDPYLGVAKIDLLLKGEAFPETALKGIPNIIAPRLLQEWRLEQCDLIKLMPSKRQALKSNLLTAKPESTEYGIFLHARTVIEAAFWLIFTKEKSINLQQIEPKKSEFCALIKTEFECFNEQMPTLFVVDSKSQQPLFIANKNLGWYLAANKTACCFLAKIMPQLPSVKYGDDFLCDLWRANNSKPTLSVYDHKVIGAFVGYLADVKNKLQHMNSLLLKALESLVEDLTKIIGVIELTPDNTKLGLETVKSVKEFEFAGGKIEFKELALLGRLQNLFVEKPIYVDAKSAEECLWPLKGEAWQYIDIEKTMQEVEQKNAFAVKNTKKSDEDNRGEWLWQQLKIHFKDIGEQVYDKPFGDNVIPEVSIVQDNFMWSSAIWPNFEANHWIYYLATGDSYKINQNQIKNLFATQSLKGDCVEFVFFGDLYTEDAKPATIDIETKKIKVKTQQPNEPILTPDFGILGVVKNNSPIKLMGVPRSIEMWFGGQLLGSLPIKLAEGKKLVDSERECRIALDFGTSNTSVAVQFKQDGKDPEINDLPLLEGEQSASGLFSLNKDKSLTWSAGYKNQGRYPHQYLPTFFFQAFNKKQSEQTVGTTRSIPSELLFISGVNNPTIRSDIKHFLSQHDVSKTYYSFSAIKKFGGSSDLRGTPVAVPLWTPFPPSVDDDLKKALMGNTNAEYVQGFKWPTADIEYAYRAAYLESIIVTCFATLRKSGYRKIKASHHEEAAFIATYPGAFTAEQKVSYINDLEATIDSLKRQCGIDLLQEVVNPDYKNKHQEHIKADKEKHSFLLRSETFAALAGCRRDKSDVSLTIDMGGGTTDIGLIIPPKEDSTDVPDSYMSSLRYAGNHLLSALVEYDRKKQSLANSDNLLLALKLAIRDGKVELDGDKTKHFKVVTEAFFRGMFEYTFSLIAAHAHKLAQRPINIYFLGNGFKLAKLFAAKDIESIFLDICIKEAEKNNLWPLGFNPVFSMNKFSKIKNQDLKQILIHGALEQNTDAHKSGYDVLEQKGHGNRAIWLPCIKNTQTNQPWPQVTLGLNDSEEGELSSDISHRRNAFKLTNKYWDDDNWEIENVSKDFVFGGVASSKVAYDFGKFYLEENFVKEVLFKLTKEPKPKAVESKKSNKQQATSSSEESSPPQKKSGFKPSSASATISSPPTSSQTSSMVVLSSGANTPINGNKITVKLSWHCAFDLDVIAFVLNAQAKVGGDDDTIFYNQPAYQHNVITLNAAANELVINLNNIPPHVAKIAICAVTGIDDQQAQGKSFAQVSSPAIQVNNEFNQALVKFDLANIAGAETAMIFGEIYRHNNSWKFRAVGQGYAGGFKTMCHYYGADFS